MPKLEGAITKNIPMFMDVHKNVDGLTATGVIEVQKKDLETQEKHGVKYLKYWFNEAEGTVYYLFEGPSKEAG